MRKLKILQINKFFYRKGGAETYFLSLSELLQQHGHTVIPFAMQHENNLESPFSQNFVSEIDLTAPKMDLKTVKTIGRALWSSEAQKKLEALIIEQKPDIAHLHNIYRHLTPSIIPILKKHQIPIVMTLHDYYAITPNYLLFNGLKIDETSKNSHFYNLLRNKSIEGSLPLSLVGMLEGYLYKWKKVWGMVDAYHAPSQFLLEKFKEFGFSNAERITYYPLFLSFDVAQDKEERRNNKSKNKDKYFLFAGRLSVEKGISVVVNAFKDLPVKLKIAGDGPEEKTLKAVARKSANIEFLGYQNKDELQKLINGAYGVIVSSLCYENAPYAVTEVMAQGGLVIASNIGGIPELVEDGKSGLLFEPGNGEELKEKIVYSIEYKEKMASIRQNASQFVKEKLNADIHYEKVMGLYEQVV